MCNRISVLCAATSALLLLTPAIAMTRPQVDLSALDKGMDGGATQVLVLGTVHLRTMADDFNPSSLEPLLDRLAAFEPGIITIEAISGANCETMSRYPERYDADSLAPYCADTTAARAATGLDVHAATIAMDALLAQWPKTPTPAQRRHLASLFLAAGDPASALVQWLQLPEAQRRAGDGLDTTLVAMLDGLRTRHDEDYLISAPLAARLGLQRVYPIDDHTGDSVQVPDGKIDAYVAAIKGAWASAAATAAPVEAREKALKDGGDMLALYRYVNGPAVLAIKVDADFGAAMRDASPGHPARNYVAGWETRNLRMVANIREAFRERPGARVLSVVGSSHKPWFDNLLGQMQGVDIVDVEQLLRPAPR